MPVVSVCSKERHDGQLSYSTREQRTSIPEDLASVLDIHTSEAPITITTLNIDLSIEDLGLMDFVVNGILDVYVVERKVSPESGHTEPGQDGIFLADEAWVSLSYH
jgi:hypothetical protein